MAPSFVTSDYDRVEERSSFSSDGLEELKLSERLRYEVNLYKKRYRRLRIVNAISIITLVLSYCYAFLAYVHPQNKSLPLGADPFGYVPTDVGEPPMWTVFDENDPYHIDYDVFDSIENTEKVVQRLDNIDHAVGILTHGKNTSYLGSDGTVHELPPITRYPNTYEGTSYIIRAFHQMHCVAFVIGEHSRSLHGHKKQDPKHVAHCMNLLRQAVSCLADSSVVSYNYPGDYETARDQQFRCRNYRALRKWADDPVRVARYRVEE